MNKKLNACTEKELHAKLGKFTPALTALARERAGCRAHMGVKGSTKHRAAA
jgi:hypothetical protein